MPSKAYYGSTFWPKKIMWKAFAVKNSWRRHPDLRPGITVLQGKRKKMSNLLYYCSCLYGFDVRRRSTV